jgi:hypothetical protein
MFCKSRLRSLAATARPGLAAKRAAALVALPFSLCSIASAGSILVPNAGVETYRSWVVYSTVRATQSSLANTSVDSTGISLTTGYGVAGTLLLGTEMQVQHVRTPGMAGQTMFAPTAVRGKWNFWSKLESGEYHRLALIGRAGLPAARQAGLYAVPATPETTTLRMLDSGFTPGLDLVYSRSKGRMVYGAGVGYALPLTRNGSRSGREATSMVDAEFLVKRWGDSELSLVTGLGSRYSTRAQYQGTKLWDTGGTEVAATFGAQMAIHSSTAFEVAYRHNVWQKIRTAQPRFGSEVVVGFRYLR